MKYITNIEKERFDEFVKNHPSKSHFLQSYAWGEVKKETGLIPHYVGIEEDGELKATALLLQKKLLVGYSYFYAPRGYVLDFNNYELLSFFTAELKRYVKKRGGIFLKIDPDLILHDINHDGEPIKSASNYEVILKLKKMGYVHHGFNKNFETSQPRYTFRLDLSQSVEDIRSNMHSTIRKILNKENPYDLKVEKGNVNDIKDFSDLMNITSKRDDFISSSYSYYQTFYTILNKYKMADIYSITVSTKDIIEKHKKILKEVTDKIEKTKKEGIKKDLLSKKKKLEEDLKEYLTYPLQYPDKVVISSIITAKYGDKIWTIHGGNHDIFRELNANYILYYQILLKAKEEGYRVFDFFGTTGDPKPDNKIYGIHLFKKRFGGQYIEFIGEFDLITNKLLYFVYAKLIPIYHSIIKRMKKIFRKKASM